DALSSQATVSGYKAVLIASERLPRFFPMLMTAAGTIPPAKVLVLGAGVAGLQAIATARRLGAVVSGFDVRPVVKEQVESLGVTLVGLTNLPSTMASHASQLYARNVSALLALMVKDGALSLDWDDQVLAGACVTRKEES